MENFLVCEKGSFFSPCKANRKRKAFFSAQRHRLRTAPKLTSSHKFHLRKPTVSLHYNNSFSKNISLASAVQLPFRTDSKPLCRRFAGKTGFDMSRRKTLQNHFRQSFESSPESRGSQTSGVLLVLFVQAKRINPFPFREASRCCKPRSSPPQRQLHTATIKTFLRELRGSANLEKSAYIAGNFVQTNEILLPPCGGRFRRLCRLFPPAAASIRHPTAAAVRRTH